MKQNPQEVIASGCLLTMLAFGVAVTILIVALAVSIL